MSVVKSCKTFVFHSPLGSPMFDISFLSHIFMGCPSSVVCRCFNGLAQYHVRRDRMHAKYRQIWNQFVCDIAITTNHIFHRYRGINCSFSAKWKRKQRRTEMMRTTCASAIKTLFTFIWGDCYTWTSCDVDDDDGKCHVYVILNNVVGGHPKQRTQSRGLFSIKMYIRWISLNG